MYKLVLTIFSRLVFGDRKNLKEKSESKVTEA